MNRVVRRRMPTIPVREFRLRQIRAGAQTLRSLCPTATNVDVKLEFLPAAALTPAAQSLVLYPGAKAVFAYPCPYGDCDGIYDLTAEADQALNRDVPRMTGISTCSGTRPRDGGVRQACGLSVRYTISARHEIKARA